MSNILPVPHRLQIADGYCLPACVQMVLAYWGIERKQADLARQLKTLPLAGTTGSRLYLLISPTLDVTYRKGDLPDLQAALRERIPPIAFVDTRELPYWNKIATAHAVVVLGMDNNSIVLNDPAINQSAVEVAIGDFHLAWDEMLNLFALLRKKES